ncbi:cupin domain-containing protein [Hymenobacter gummosus]|uniref:Cupin domain-containing protein n=1 Tax=Hymenobacter gummosus TaxID=1776032 RepID=A0A3S0K2Q4_9BACT|nr:cupin domain-containing protein [Hymenobacter gummosus]RTQ46824.1 cupin domain-containing protein [Hymenobacter gummosus]
MNRRRFLLTGLLAAPAAALPARAALALARPVAATPAFVVPPALSRFQEKTLINNCPNDIKISGRDTGGAVALFEYTGLAKGGPSLHRHLAQDEVFYVVEGRYLFVVGPERHELTAGATIFLPRQVPHTWTQLTATGKLLYWVQPAGQLEDYFRRIASGQPRGTAAERAALALAHGIEQLGPPLPVQP